MKKIIVLPLLLTVFLSSCSISQNSEDLTGFLTRLNSTNSSYNIEQTGFIYNNTEHSIYKFFYINEDEVLLSFKKDSVGRLTELNFVTQNQLTKNEATFTFFKNTLKAFVNNEVIFEKIISDKSLEAAFGTINNTSFATKNGNISIMLDVTEIGTVISVYKDI